MISICFLAVEELFADICQQTKLDYLIVYANLGIPKHMQH